MQIAFLLYEGFTALDIVGPFDVLSRLPGAEARFVSLETGPVRNDNQHLAMVADFSLEETPTPEILVVPGGTRTAEAIQEPRYLEWLRNAHPHTTWTTSVCTGSLLLGAAGLLRGAGATCHWSQRQRLAELGAEYQPERFVRHDKIVTAAGVSAGIDMALWLADQIAGRQVAEIIQLGIEYDPQPPFDSGSLQKASATTVALAESRLSSAE